MAVNTGVWLLMSTYHLSQAAFSVPGLALKPLEGPPASWGFKVDEPFGLPVTAKPQKAKIVAFVIDRTYTPFLQKCIEAPHVTHPPISRDHMYLIAETYVQ